MASAKLHTISALVAGHRLSLLEVTVAQENPVAYSSRALVRSSVWAMMISRRRLLPSLMGDFRDLRGGPRKKGGLCCTSCAMEPSCSHFSWPYPAAVLLRLPARLN